MPEILRLRLRMTARGGAGTGTRDPSAAPQDDSGGLVHEILRLRRRMTVGSLVREIPRLCLRMTIRPAAPPTCHPEPTAKDLMHKGCEMGAWCMRSFGCASG